jgi:hypothetical protein
MNINEPWEAQLDWAPDFPRGSHVFDADGNEIATNVDGFQATLIAAAPDLLKRLEALVKLVQNQPLMSKREFNRSAETLIWNCISTIMKAQGN